MQYELIQGFHDSAHQLLYAPGEKHLYVQKYNRSGQLEFICYESILPQEYRNKNEPNHSNCTARAILRENICYRNQISHQGHQNHELVYRDLKTLNAVKEKCKKLVEWCPLSAAKISAKELLAVELSKYVFLFI